MKTYLTYLALIAFLCVKPSSFAQPVITQQPTNKTVYVGSSANFSVKATGTDPLTYQWHFNGADLIGKTSKTLGLTGIKFTNAGPYTVTVSNADGVVTSQTAWL